MTAAAPAEASGFVPASGGARIFWQAAGNREGIPALVVHGGPGSGAGPGWFRHFDLDRFRVILVDQRGCGRSTPSAADQGADLAGNTTDALIADFELVRRELGVERWLLLGASWGSTLALAYAEAHPAVVSALVLFSVTTTTRAEVEWITRDLGRVFPAQWEDFVTALPEHDRGGDLPAGYARLLADPDPDVVDAAARAWCAWEDTHTSLAPGWRPDGRYDDPTFRRAFARLVTHYWSAAAWRGPTELLDGVDAIAHLPAALIHGRHDISSPLGIPWALHRRWPGSTLTVVEAGHGAGMDRGVRQALDRMAVLPVR